MTIKPLFLFPGWYYAGLDVPFRRRVDSSAATVVLCVLSLLTIFLQYFTQLVKVSTFCPEGLFTREDGWLEWVCFHYCHTLIPFTVMIAPKFLLFFNGVGAFSFIHSVLTWNPLRISQSVPVVLASMLGSKIEHALALHLWGGIESCKFFFHLDAIFVLYVTLTLIPALPIVFRPLVHSRFDGDSVQLTTAIGNFSIYKDATGNFSISSSGNVPAGISARLNAVVREMALPNSRMMPVDEMPKSCLLFFDSSKAHIGQGVYLKVDKKFFLATAGHVWVEASFYAPACNPKKLYALADLKLDPLSVISSTCNPDFAIVPLPGDIGGQVTGLKSSTLSRACRDASVNCYAAMVEDHAFKNYRSRGGLKLNNGIFGHTSSTLPGWSGCPLFSNDGTVVAIHVGAVPDFSVNEATPLTVVFQMLFGKFEIYKNKESPANSHNGDYRVRMDKLREMADDGRIYYVAGGAYAIVDRRVMYADDLYEHDSASDDYDSYDDYDYNSDSDDSYDRNDRHDYRSKTRRRQDDLDFVHSYMGDIDEERTPLNGKPTVLSKQLESNKASASVWPLSSAQAHKPTGSVKAANATPHEVERVRKLFDAISKINESTTSGKVKTTPQSLKPQPTPKAKAKASPKEKPTPTPKAKAAAKKNKRNKKDGVPHMYRATLPESYFEHVEDLATEMKLPVATPVQPAVWWSSDIWSLPIPGTGTREHLSTTAKFMECVEAPIHAMWQKVGCFRTGVPPGRDVPPSVVDTRDYPDVVKQFITNGFSMPATGAKAEMESLLQKSTRFIEYLKGYKFDFSHSDVATFLQEAAYPKVRPPLFLVRYLRSFHFPDCEEEFDESFQQAFLNLPRDSSPGTPWMTFGKNGDIHEYHLTELYLEVKTLFLMLVCNDLTGLDSYNLFRCTGLAWKLFVKKELHPERKVRTRSWRLIFSSPLPFTILSRMINGPLNDEEIRRHNTICSKPGISLSGVLGPSAMRAYLDKWNSVVSTDVPEWDWHYTDKLEEFNLYARFMALDFTHVREEERVGIFRLLSNMRCLVMRKVVQLSDGNCYAQLVDGIQPSGRYETSSNNSRARAFYHFRAVGNVNVAANGDDSLEEGSEDLVNAYARFGVSFKDDPAYHDKRFFEFCSKYFMSDDKYTYTCPVPGSVEKMLIRLMEMKRIDHAYWPQAMESISMEMIYHPFYQALVDARVLCPVSYDPERHEWAFNVDQGQGGYNGYRNF